MVTMTMKTDELLRRLADADPSGNREVYLIAWFGDGEPLADFPVDVYVDDDDDLVISGLLRESDNPRPGDAVGLTPFHVVMLILLTLLVITLALPLVTS